MALRSTLMDETHKYRREWLKQLIEKQFKGKQAQLARYVGMSRGQLHDKLNKRSNVGERIARRIEEKLGLAPGSLDKPVEWQDRNADRRRSEAKKPKRLQGTAA